MLQGEHSAILLTFIKLPFAIKIFVLSFFEWPVYSGFTVAVLFSHGKFTCVPRDVQNLDSCSCSRTSEL